MRRPRLFILNADDLGLTSAVTEGILTALEAGRITDVSLMPSAEAFVEAARGLKTLGRRNVGVHLTAVDREFPVVDPEAVALLLGSDRRFHARRGALFTRLLRRSGRTLTQAGREWRAQIVRVREQGLCITHLDSHQHLHLFPGLAELALDLAREYAIPFVRVPRFRRLRPGRPVSAAVNLLAWRLARLAARTGIGTVGFAGLERSGRHQGSDLADILAEPGEGVVEVALHPGRQDAHTETKYAHWGFAWAGELASLEHPAVRQSIEQRAVVLTCFADMAGLAATRLSSGTAR